MGVNIIWGASKEKLGDKINSIPRRLKAKDSDQMGNYFRKLRPGYLNLCRMLYYKRF